MESEINNALLKQLAEHSAQAILNAIEEKEPEILKDIQAMREEEGADERPLVFTFSFSGKLNFDRNVITCRFAYPARRKVETEHVITDPSQPELPL